MNSNNPKIFKHCGLEMHRTETPAGTRMLIEYHCRHCGQHELELRSANGVLLNWQNLTAKKAARAAA